MKNIGRSTLFFTDRPVRMAGHYHTRDEFLPLWSEGPDSFAKNPPNATLSMLEVGKADLQNAVINLKNPRMQGKDLIYDITIIEGTVPQSAGDAVLFIDILGFWRRNIRRVAIIGTAAAVTTAAVATSAAASQEAAAKAAAAKPAPPPTVNVQITEKPAAPPPAVADDAEARATQGAAKGRSHHRGPVSEGVAAGPQRNGAIGDGRRLDAVHWTRTLSGTFADDGCQCCAVHDLPRRSHYATSHACARFHPMARDRDGTDHAAGDGGGSARRSAGDGATAVRAERRRRGGGCRRPDADAEGREPDHALLFGPPSAHCRPLPHRGVPAVLEGRPGQFPEGPAERHALGVREG